MSAVPIRIRLTIAFATATSLLLVGAFLFVYLRLQADLNEAIDSTLRARATAAAELLDETGSISSFAIEDAEEAFVQLVSPTGSVIDTVGGAIDSVFSSADLPDVASDQSWAETVVAGIDGRVRILAVATDDASGNLLLIGQSLVNRDDALRDVRTSFLVGGPIAVAVASLLGYTLARAGFAPVEAIRRSAADMSLTGDGRRLPLPSARDEIHRLTETLNEMIARLEAAFERERTFVADASHELRTPIAVIKTELEAALLANDDTSLRAGLRAAIDECDLLAQLADDLLVTARLDQNGLPIRKEQTEIIQLFGDVRDRFADRAGRYGRTIEIDAMPEEWVNVDPLRLRQALSNLVDNALRHGAGTITLRTRQGIDTVDLDVVDEGPGFDNEIASHAFERFTRGARARQSSGAGLGLAIVQAIAAAHGGGAAQLEPPESGVRVTLPLRQK